MPGSLALSPVNSGLKAAATAPILSLPEQMRRLRHEIALEMFAASNALRPHGGPLYWETTSGTRKLFVQWSTEETIPTGGLPVGRRFSRFYQFQ